MALQLSLHDTAQRMRQFYALTKPRVTLLAVFCAVIGMFLATPGMVPWRVLFAGTAGIALLAGAAFAINCLIEQEIDAKMARTRARPLPRGELTSLQTVVFAGVIGGIGMFLLYSYVNALTMWLTFGTFVGYAVIYTIVLKPATPQNIVIGGLSGAMPPLLGWTAVTGSLSLEPVLLFMIILFWTPPHFWALALYRTGDYARAGIPMLPVVAGDATTRRHIMLYTVVLVPLGIAPWMLGFAGALYGGVASVTGAIMLTLAGQVLCERRPAERACRNLFAFSILYLFLLFATLLVERGWGGLIARLTA